MSDKLIGGAVSGGTTAAGLAQITETINEVVGLIACIVGIVASIMFIRAQYYRVKADQASMSRDNAARDKDIYELKKEKASDTKNHV